MKNLSLLVILCTLFFTPIQGNAQAALLGLIFGDKIASEDFNLSLEFGVNYSGITNFQTHQRAIETNFGMAGNIKLSDKYYLSPTVFFSSGRKLKLSNYSLNSGNSSLDQEFIDQKAEITLDYIDVNIPLFYQINKFRVGVAPQVSFLKDADLKIDNDFGVFDYDMKHQVNNLDYGLLSILSYELGTARKGKGLFLQFRYYQGFGDIFKAPVSTNNRNNYFSLHLSLPFISEELAKNKLESHKN
jgi:hypothetical protein